ncbi:MAG: FtsX-like permease family protein [Chloroflexi bacterium]|nr:FtsX-like permease family protein [Chloroflexota bacterium]MBM4452984.1 FtsX-like permease family protein [Chloroflexota bacterium]
MSLWESVIASWQSLYSNKMRSGLTILGIVIGISAVVFLVSFGRGHMANMKRVFEGMGANAIYIMNATRLSSEITGGINNLTLEDAEAIAASHTATAVEVVSPICETRGRVSYGNKDTVTAIRGAFPNIDRVVSYPVANGRFLSEEDLKRTADVVLLGYKTAKDLFGDSDPLDKYIRVAGRKLRIIGVMEEKGGMIGTADDFVLIPLSTYQARITGVTTVKGRPVQTIAVKAFDPDSVDEAKAQVTSILRQRHRIREGADDDFNVIDMREIINRMLQVIGIFQVFLGSVGAISLLVGGIGIMNIMLVSVTERTREIGIRKAVGAKRRDILSQFLVESALLSATGGVIGLMLAFLGTRLVTGAKVGTMTVSAPMSVDIVIIALSVAVFVGLASGFYPAFRAARLDPIESLRHE